MKPFELFVACLPGLEQLLAGEMQACGFRGLEVQKGGVGLAGHSNAVYRANLELGVALRVLLRIGRFRVRSFPELIRKTAHLDWATWLVKGRPFDVSATCRKSRLYHSTGVKDRVALGIFEKLGQRPPLPENGNATWPTVRVRLVEDACTLSLDTTGVPLFRRGYKQQVGKAPLREDLARALILASGWDTRSVLVDPLCGAGTIAIEAATLARRLAPGRLRQFAFQATSIFDDSAWQRVLAEAEARSLEAAPSKVFGSDRDRGVLDAARANAARAGVADDLELVGSSLSRAPFLGGTPPAPAAGALVTNPPYGERLGGGDLRSLYQTLGQLAATLPGSWQIALLAANRRLALKTGLRLETAFLTDHGGRKVRALVRRSSAIASPAAGSP